MHRASPDALPSTAIVLAVGNTEGSASKTCTGIKLLLNLEAANQIPVSIAQGKKKGGLPSVSFTLTRNPPLILYAFAVLQAEASVDRIVSIHRVRNRSMQRMLLPYDNLDIS